MFYNHNSKYLHHYINSSQETVVVKNIPTNKSRAASTAAAVVVILIDNLCKSTAYYFCVSAINLGGKSPNSEVVQCTTLQPSECVVPGKYSNYTYIYIYIYIYYKNMKSRHTTYINIEYQF